jgi:hypothetical protein
MDIENEAENLIEIMTKLSSHQIVGVISITFLATADFKIDHNFCCSGISSDLRFFLMSQSKSLIKLILDTNENNYEELKIINRKWLNFAKNLIVFHCTKK